jgi:hypothetical protein
MKKILLIEDRPKRQKDFMNEVKIDLSDYSDILDNKINDEYNKFIEDIKKDTFDLTQYNIIIVHNSIFLNENSFILGKLKKYCKSTNASLVLFSGNDDNTYNNEEYEEVGLNSQDLYSKNLELFLNEYKKGNQYILILCYGNKWKANILLNGLEKINIYIVENNIKEKVLLNRFRNYNSEFLNKKDKLNIEFYKYSTIHNNKIYLTEIIKFRDNILEHIKEIADE